MDADQPSQLWIEWLARADSDLEAFFRTVPSLGEDPYSREGLIHARAVAKQTLPNWAAVERGEFDVADWEEAAPFIRFIGEVFRRNFEGEWINNSAPGNDGPKVSPEVELPFGAGIDPAGLLCSEFLLDTYDYTAEDHAEWVAAGRPTGDALRKWKPYLFQ
ncbi:hypothetical protein [Nocardia blacklockiae]|uniref:hypothetical protein n=1 Tax=Nocardia blacklockiae TaxID=480036 RepID=UPI001893F009|nr:hypothetical protein [Nocardia blacklockiae]MBF6175966.1 hypothetical protein [Nocardia blacklockiae]